jgi:large subunit ribosomal protein L3
MLNTLLGIKKGMTSTYDARGRRVGATVVEVSSNFVTQIKTSDSKDGYSSVQLGFGTKKSVRKPQIGHAKKAGVEQPIRWFREVKADEANVNPGQELKVSDVFLVGDSVKVSGVSKGKGFQGGVRRWGFHGGPKTHGQSDRHRAPGSVGQGTTPGRVYRGKKMAGHMGSDSASALNLEVVAIDKTQGLLTIKGAVPGAIGGLVTITKLGKIKGYTAPPEEKVEEEEEGAVVENQEVVEESTEQVAEQAPVEEKGEENASE